MFSFVNSIVQRSKNSFPSVKKKKRFEELPVRRPYMRFRLEKGFKGERVVHLRWEKGFSVREYLVDFRREKGF